MWVKTPAAQHMVQWVTGGAGGTLGKYPSCRSLKGTADIVLEPSPTSCEHGAVIPIIRDSFTRTLKTDILTYGILMLVSQMESLHFEGSLFLSYKHY